ncbi:MAG: hypothetical protein IT374_25380 [Polyangiaceae bacterium]|nr:hypothetical protein [Polyangiaceae bacterium]
MTSPRAVALSLAGALAACGGAEPSDPPAAQAPASFVAFARDFEGFESWAAFPLGPGTPAVGEIEGPRTVFASRLPAPGEAALPVGTKLVKVIGDGPVETRQVFAMAKRGGDYNAFGAKGWEWFELTRDARGAVSVDWRGVSPPDGTAYGTNLRGGACNECHVEQGAATDAVLTPGVAPTGR